MNRVGKMKRDELNRKNLMLVLLTVVLIVLCFYFVSMIAKSKTDLERAELENYYKPLEQQLVADARALLEEQGYKNSGVMLTRVIEEDGSREYKLTVHHAKLDRMSDAEREEVAQCFATIYFQDSNCSFEHAFLLNN